MILALGIMLEIDHRIGSRFFSRVHHFVEQVINSVRVLASIPTTRGEKKKITKKMCDSETFLRPAGHDPFSDEVVVCRTERLTTSKIAPR